MPSRHHGSSFDSFLEEEGLLEEVEAAAIKRVVSMEIEQSMEQLHMSKTEMAQRMNTSRSALDRLLDPNNTSITLQTLVKVAHVLGKRLEISFAE